MQVEAELRRARDLIAEVEKATREPYYDRGGWTSRGGSGDPRGAEGSGHGDGVGDGVGEGIGKLMEEASVACEDAQRIVSACIQRMKNIELDRR